MSLSSLIAIVKFQAPDSENYLLLFLEANLCSSIRISMLDVPSPTILGEAVELTCSYELEPDLKLYSVKWYKDGVEFYRYVPNDYPAAQTLPIEGIKVEVSCLTFSHLIYC
uniref:Ig-like domain-containing protein n=1 Tax=Tetranychus urticae TaxID=32264 RepID=T1KR91_TETUR